MAREKIVYHPYAANSRQVMQPQPVQTAQHCLVCHQTFDPFTNQPNSCNISHLWQSDAGVLDASFTGTHPRLVYFAKCCNAAHTAYLDEDEDDEYGHAYTHGAFCYSGPHVTDPAIFNALRQRSQISFRSCNSMGCADGQGGRRYQRYMEKDHSVPLAYNADKTWDDERGRGPAIDGAPYDQSRVGRRQDIEKQIEQRRRQEAAGRGRR
ncbi:hypothetical protein FRC04_005507 [Tulasnella sp. 424]|nr:hypothetical protein FRC04_005507 [Tulasnella sp. 424]KAG8974993.1 hypothetical protein FRC05_006670 [Tulasnella sp. 425]